MLREGSTTKEELIRKHTQTPEVRLVRVVVCFCQHLGSQVSHCAARGGANGNRILFARDGRDPKVGEIRSALEIKANILRLQVSMDHPSTVDVMKS